MDHHLPGRQNGRGKSKAINNIIDAALQKAQQSLSRDSLFSKGLFHIVSKLFFRDPIGKPQLLFLDQAFLKIADLSPKLRVHSGKSVSLL